MTINSEVRTAGPYTGSGGTGPFSFAFEVFATSELLVQTKKISDGTIATLALTTDYTVSLNANQNASPGGTITLVASLSSAYTLTMTSAVQFKQATQLTNNGPFFAKTITTCLDRLTILAQQVKVTASRAIKFPIVDGTSLTTDIPAAAQRASKALIFDSSGNVTVSVDNYNDQLANVTAQAVAAQASADAAEASEDLTAADVISTHADVVTTGTNATTSTTQAGIATTQAGTATTQASTATTQAGLAATAKTACDNDKTACDADVVLTHADVVLTHADVVLTHADVVLTHADAVSTAADEASTDLDAAATAADRVQTGLDVTAAAASAAAAAASAASGLYQGIDDKTFSDSPIIPLLATKGNLYRIDTSGGNVVVNLSALATYAQNMILAFVKTTADANTITINRGGTDTISGSTSIVLTTEYEVHVLVGETSTGKWLDTVQTTGIADGAVTLAKMANVSSSTVFYRKTAGTGAPEVQTLATLKTDLGLTGTNSGDQTISDATITTTDITTNNFTTSKHGFVPKGTNVGNFLKDDGTFAALPAGSATGYTGSGYVAGRYYTGLGQGSWGGNTLVVASGRQYFVPAIIGKAVTLTKIGIKVATGAGTNCRLGIYNMANGVPTSLVVDAGAVTVSSTGIKEATINVALSPGAYAFCALFDNTPTVDYYQNAGNENILDEFWGMASWGAASPVYGAYAAQSYGALPDPFAGSLTYTASSVTMPIIYVRA